MQTTKQKKLCYKINMTFKLTLLKFHRQNTYLLTCLLLVCTVVQND
jgi:hypothetical protein